MTRPYSTGSPQHKHRPGHSGTRVQSNLHEDCAAPKSWMPANSCHTLRAANTAPGRLHQKPPRSRERFLDLQSPLILLSSHFFFLQGNRNSEVKYQHHMPWFEVSSYPDLFKKKKKTNRLLQCKTKLKVKLDCEES